MSIPTHTHTLTVYVETTELGYHRAGVDLTHVTISIGFLQLAYMQTPRAVDDFLRGLATSRHSEDAAGRAAGPGTSAALVRDRDTCIMRHDPRVDRENRLVRGAQPTDLKINDATRRDANAEHRFPNVFFSRECAASGTIVPERLINIRKEKKSWS